MSETHTKLTFLEDLRWRGLIHQATDEQGLSAHLASGDPAERKAYVGFDPTADSLTIGNLVGIMNLARFQRAGHTPIALMGGATGLIGDPSGKSAERQLNTPETVAANVARIERIFDRVLDFSSGAKNAAKMVNNIEWFGEMKFLDALRDIGKHFSVNMMIQKESVKERLTNRDQGISYTEFSYMLLQGYDFAHLCEKQGVTLQMGGSDQFGNIVVGSDLIRKRMNSTIDAIYMQKLYTMLRVFYRNHPAARVLISEMEVARDDRSLPSIDRMSLLSELRDRAIRFIKTTPCERTDTDPTDLLPDIHSSQSGPFGLTWPLVTKADGTKFGKTESGSIWLSSDRTSVYQYYQFWLNAADADVVRFLKIYTFLPRADIEALEASVATNPGAREAQRTLAREATRILHGESEMLAAEAAGQALFSGEVAGLSLATLEDVFAAVPSTSHPKASLEGDGVSLLDLVVEAKLAASKREGREFLQNGSISVNGRKAGIDERLRTSDLLHGALILLRRGKKQWLVTRWGG